LTTGNGLLWALSLFAIYEEVRVYRIRLESKKREELFQIPEDLANNTAFMYFKD